MRADIDEIALITRISTEPDVRASFVAVVGELDGLDGGGLDLGSVPWFRTQIRPRYSNDIVRHVQVEALAGVAIIIKT